MSHYVLSTLRGGQFCAWCDAEITQYNAGGLCPNTPKPATPEAPEWKIAPPPRALLDLADMERKARQEVCGITDLMRGVSSPEDRALSDFIARRKAKRESVAPSAPDDHPWARAGHTHADWSTDACPKCRLTGQEVRELGYYPKCDDYKREREERAKLVRALSIPLPHDPPMSVRLMPWRGK